MNTIVRWISIMTAYSDGADDIILFVHITAV